MGVYSRDDLYTLWMNFRGQSNELQMMQDFGLCSKDEAQKLINEFETRMEVETLDGDHRGKEDRGAVEYGKPTKPTKPKKTAMMFHNGLCRQSTAGFLVLPRLRQLCIKAVQMVGPEVLQLDRADFGVDPLQHILVADSGFHL